MTKHLTFLLFFLALTACKKEPKQSISLCASQYNEVIDLYVKFCTTDKGKRAIIYRSESNQPFEIIKEINPTNIKNDSLFVIDTTLKFSGNYAYKVSYGGVVSDAIAVNFDKDAKSIYIPTTVKDTLTIKADYNCSTYNFQLYNRWGELIINKQYLTGNLAFDISKYPNDTYVYRLILGKREIRNTVAFTH